MQITRLVAIPFFAAFLAATAALPLAGSDLDSRSMSAADAVIMPRHSSADNNVRDAGAFPPHGPPPPYVNA